LRRPVLLKINQVTKEHNILTFLSLLSQCIHSADENSNHCSGFSNSAVNPDSEVKRDTSFGLMQDLRVLFSVHHN